MTHRFSSKSYVKGSDEQMDRNPEATTSRMAANGDFPAPPRANACARICHWLLALGGDPDGSLHVGGDGTASECSGNSGCKLCGDAATAFIDRSIRKAGQVDVCNGRAAVVGENAAAWIHNAISLGFEQCRRPSVGCLVGDRRAFSAAVDVRFDCSVESGSGGCNRKREMKVEGCFVTRVRETSSKFAF